MDLDNSNIKTISKYVKTTLNNDNEGTAEKNHCVSPQNTDYFSKIAQAMNKVEQLLFNDYELNQDDHIIVSECHENNDITAEDKVKLLTAQVESLKQQLLVKESELQATQQELNYTNQDLAAALKPDILTFAEAKELAKNILLGKQPIYECFAKLLRAIYNSPVDASELAPIDKIDKIDKNNFTLNDELNKLKFMRKALKEGNIALRTKSISLRNKVAELKAKSKDIIEKTTRYKN